MHRGYRLYLEDILTAAVKIQRFIGTSSFEEFIGDDKTYDAVIRNFEINLHLIHEATVRVF